MRVRKIKNRGSLIYTQQELYSYLDLFPFWFSFSKHFVSNKAFSDHVKSKPHKRRLNALKTEPYTIEESERAAGMGSYYKKEPKKRKMETMEPAGVRKGEKDAEDVVKKAKMDKDGDQKM